MKRLAKFSKTVVALVLLGTASTGYACSYQLCYFYKCCVYNWQTDTEICGVKCMWCDCMQAP